MVKWQRDITLFLSSQSISLFGSAIVQYAIMWHVTLTTQSGMMMTIFIICGFLPTFFLSPFAGVWADRYSRKKLIMLADGGIALATLVLALLFLSGYSYIWLLFIIAAIRAFGAGIQTPAVGAILPQIVPEDQLMRVNGINGSIQAVTFFAAPMVSAALLSLFSLELVLFVDVITATIAIVTLSFLRMQKQAINDQQLSYVEDFKSGIRYIVNEPFLKPLFMFFALLFLLMAPSAFLTPLQVARTFGDDVWRLTAIELAFSVGMMLGGALIASWQGFTNRTHTMIFGGVAYAACTVAFGFIPNFWVYVGFMGLCGVSLPIFNTPTMTMLQEKVDPNYLGRIFGVFSMISSSMMPLGMLIFGPLADIVAIKWLLIISGVIMIVLILLLWNNKNLIAAGQPATKPTNEL